MTSPLARRREVYRRALRETLSRLVDLLSADPTVERVILFGSYYLTTGNLESRPAPNEA
jgi:hypothetical protein